MQFGLFYEWPNPFTTYGNSPAPLLQALYIGQRTRRLKIGTAAVILPVWQPLPLAEEVAVLDNLIDGRFLCGIGRGYQPYAMAGFGDNVGESRQRFQETLEVLLLDDKSLMDRLFFRTPRPSSPSSNAPPVWT